MHKVYELCCFMLDDEMHVFKKLKYEYRFDGEAEELKKIALDCRIEQKQSATFNICQPRECVYKGTIYYSTADMASELGITFFQAQHWIRNGYDPKGNPCRYVDDTRGLPMTKRVKKSRYKPVIVNEKRYSSLRKASLVLLVKERSLMNYLRGERHNPKYKVMYEEDYLKMKEEERLAKENKQWGGFDVQVSESESEEADSR